MLLFQKNSFSIPSDSSGILLVRVISVRRVSSLRHGKIGSFLKITIRNTKPELIRKKKKKTRAIVIRSSHTMIKKKECFFFFCDNALVLLKKRMNTVGKELYGPTSKLLRIKKFKIAFKCVF